MDFAACIGPHSQFLNHVNIMYIIRVNAGMVDKMLLEEDGLTSMEKTYISGMIQMVAFSCRNFAKEINPGYFPILLAYLWLLPTMIC